MGLVVCSTAVPDTLLLTFFLPPGLQDLHRMSIDKPDNIVKQASALQHNNMLAKAGKSSSQLSISRCSAKFKWKYSTIQQNALLCREHKMPSSLVGEFAQHCEEGCVRANA